MTNVLSQLQAILSDLTAQEEALTTQLQQLREQLSGLRAVIVMFDETATPAVETIAPATEAAVETSLSAATPQVKESAPAAAKQPANAKRTQSTVKKQDGRAASWQKYTRPGVKNASMPDAVRLILETQPSKDFKIAEVMDALFQEDMPKAQYLKARNRISNVLSGGVRAGDWYRGERSTYRLRRA
jgi:phage shock protein A